MHQMLEHSIINQKGKLTPLTIDLLATISEVDKELLHQAIILPSKKNLLNAPWYFHRKAGGGLTLGNKIYLTKNWFIADNTTKPTNFGNNDTLSVYMWLSILSHEVGHLPQQRYFGWNFIGKTRYVLFFTFGYLFRFLFFQYPIHDGFGPEIIADKGRYVFQTVFSDKLENGKIQINEKGIKLIRLLNENNTAGFENLIKLLLPEIESHQNKYKLQNERFYRKYVRML